MKDDGFSRALTLAALALLGTDSLAAWEVDTSYLSYSESDGRVSVSKSLANLTRRNEQSTVAVSLVNDTMSGASPTGAIRSTATTVTSTGASGVVSVVGGDYSKSHFDDKRQQAGLNYERTHNDGLISSFGGAVSKESDYESYGVNIDIAKTSDDKRDTYELGLAYTQDTIYRSHTDGTPEPLGNVENSREYSEGSRETAEVLLGYSRVINRRTLAQFNVTMGLSEGYHSDPYKIISAADDDDVIRINYHDSRPNTRLRTSFFSKLVHQITDSDNTIHASYRLYLDDWGVTSHTVGFRYRHQLSDKQFLEPHVRLYSQSEADFYQRKLQLDQDQNAILPADGIASADYRLDSMTSATVGMSYGFSPTPDIRLRFRAEYLDQRFSTADFDALSAVILQTSVSYSF